MKRYCEFFPVFGIVLIFYFAYVKEEELLSFPLSILSAIVQAISILALLSLCA